jgi:hypothetical protein
VVPLATTKHDADCLQDGGNDDQSRPTKDQNRGDDE